MGGESIETGATFVEYDGEIVTIRSKGVRSTSESVEDTLAAVANLVVEGKAKVLFDARIWPGGDAEAWLKVISGIERSIAAGAMVVDAGSPPGMGNFPETINRMMVPFKVFTDLDEAVAFLRSTGVA